MFFSYLEANQSRDKTIPKNIANLSIKDMFINQDSLDSEDLFEVQLYESKILLAESIISDLTGNTIEAKYQFDLLFESLSNFTVSLMPLSKSS